MNNKSFVSVFFCLLFVSLGFSQSKKSLENRRKEIQQEIRQMQAMLSKTQSESEDLLAQLEEINLQVEAQNKLINAFRSESNALDREIKTNQKAIKDLEAELKIMKDDYAEMIYMSYKSNSSNNRLMFLLSADSFRQAYKRFQYMKQYTEFRKAQGLQIQKKAELIQVKNQELLVQKQEKVALIEESKKQQLALKKQQEKQQEIVDQIKEKESDYIAQIKDKQKEERKIDKQIEKIIKDAIAKSNKGSGTSSKSSSGKATFKLTAEAKQLAGQFSANKGKLPWPLEKGFVSRRYGKQNHPTLRGIVIESNGVHITTEKGAYARAIFKGKVLQIQSVRGKKAVYIQHGNYITVYNNLETVAVKKGETVTTKQKIGKVFTDKVSKKTVLKFQIWKNTTRLNPADWIYQM